jgi:hypothetical protein
MAGSLVVDGRNCLDPISADQAGLKLIGIGWWCPQLTGIWSRAKFSHLAAQATSIRLHPWVMTWWELAVLVVWGPAAAVSVVLALTFIGMAARDRVRRGASGAQGDKP